MKNVFNYQALTGNLPTSPVPEIYHPISFSIPPNESDYKNGKYTRYFFKKINEYIFCSETSKQELDKTDKLYYNVATIDWKITGRLDSYKIDNEKVIGVKEYNEEQIRLAEKTIPQIRKILYSPTQFYRG